MCMHRQMNLSYVVLIFDTGATTLQSVLVEMLPILEQKSQQKQKSRTLQAYKVVFASSIG